MRDAEFHAEMTIDAKFTRDQALAIMGYKPGDGEERPSNRDLAKWIQEGVAEDGPDWLLRERIEVWDFRVLVTAPEQPNDHAEDCPGTNDDYMTGCHECSHCGGEALTECDDPLQCTSSRCDGEVCPCGSCEGTGHGCRQVVW